jgi:uncharacterized SAM-binding protein YcdF (DUF218 family)
MPLKKKFRIILVGIFACFIVLSLSLGNWLIGNQAALQKAKAGSIDAILVLGGSIYREIYAADLARIDPEIPILISQGAQDPCVWLVFQKDQSPIKNVWLERCAKSTFGNFYFSLPILQKWNVHKIKVITSTTHLPRAKWLGQIMLSSHGIWVEIDTADTKGVPANRESVLKTCLDLIRGIGWAFLSHYHSPQCSAVYPLQTVDIQQWKQQGFQCEYQGIKENS